MTRASSDGPSPYDIARASLDTLASVPYIGHFFALILIPRWVYESVVDESVRSGRSARSLVEWSFAWSVGTAVAMTLLLLMCTWVGLTVPGVLVVGVLVWLISPFLVGAIVGTRAPGLGGFALGFVGLALGGLLVGITVWAVNVVLGALGAFSSTSAGGSVVWIPLLTLLVPTLWGAQFGIGILAAAVAGRLRRMRLAPTPTPADDGQGAPGDRATPPAESVGEPPAAPGSIAEEGQRLKASWDAPAVPAADQRTGMTRSWWRRLILGLVVGLVVGTLGSILMIPLGEPDAAEVPFGIGMLVNFVALGISAAVWRERPRVAGVCLGLIGGWVIFWFVLVQLPPFNTL